MMNQLTYFESGIILLVREMFILSRIYHLQSPWGHLYFVVGELIKMVLTSELETISNKYLAKGGCYGVFQSIPRMYSFL